MEYSKSGLTFTERFEQFRDKAYRDTGGVWTIAWGHTRGVKEGDTCDRLQGDAWLLEDVAIAVADVNRVVSVRLTQNEFDALVDFTFNCGTKALNGSHLLAFLNGGELERAEAQFAEWDHVGGHVVAGLLRRRLDERNLFERV
jgi:lysozyme